MKRLRQFESENGRSSKSSLTSRSVAKDSRALANLRKLAAHYPRYGIPLCDLPGARRMHDGRRRGWRLDGRCGERWPNSVSRPVGEPGDHHPEQDDADDCFRGSIERARVSQSTVAKFFTEHANASARLSCIVGLAPKSYRRHEHGDDGSHPPEDPNRPLAKAPEKIVHQLRQDLSP